LHQIFSSINPLGVVFYLTLFSIISDRIMVQLLEAFAPIHQSCNYIFWKSNFSSWEIEVKMMRCFAFCSSSSFECIVNKRWTLVFVVKGKELQPMTFQWLGALWSWTLVQSFNQPLCVGDTEENSHIGLNRGEYWATTDL
jgi:hypothetical protein